MLIVLDPDTPVAGVDRVRERVESFGVRTHLSRGGGRLVLACAGEEARLRGLPVELPFAEAAGRTLRHALPLPATEVAA